MNALMQNIPLVCRTKCHELLKYRHKEMLICPACEETEGVFLQYGPIEKTKNVKVLQGQTSACLTCFYSDLFQTASSKLTHQGQPTQLFL